MKFIFFTLVFFLASPFFAQNDSLQTDTILPEIVLSAGELYGIGDCYTTYRYHRKDGNIKKEILDDHKGNKVFITYYRKKKHVKKKYKESWISKKYHPCGVVHEK